MTDRSQRVLAKTESVCPECLRKIPALRVTRGPDVYLVKNCERHGEFRTLIWRGEPDFEKWARPKVPTQPKVCYTPVKEGCPFDCGLCADHRPHTCTAILEVTERCNLGCPVCFAAAAHSSRSDPDLKTIRHLFDRVMIAAGACNIQLSGGEPTLRDDLPQIIDMGRKVGFSFIQVNTNGLRLADDKGYARTLRDAGVASVFLQFDGTEDEIYRSLRGRPLLREKRLAIDRCAENEIGVVLVPTLVPGINVHNIGTIIREALQMAPTVRGVHFQPVSYFGRYPKALATRNRITLPELMKALERQTDGLVQVSHFHPPGCENALCSFCGSFVLMSDGRLKALSSDRQQDCCGQAEKAEEGARRTVAFVARQWSGHPAGNEGRCPGPAMRVPEDGIYELGIFLDRARTHRFTITAMAFQDAWNLDLERLRDCCIHVVAPDGRLIPFCACTLTDTQGCTLYGTRWERAGLSDSARQKPRPPLADGRS